MKARLGSALALAVAAACASGGVDGPSARPDFVLRVDEVRGDEVGLATDEAGAHVCVVRKRGIGAATLTLAAGAWPRRLRLELVGFRNLESLVVCRDGLCIETDLRRAPVVTVRRGELDGTSLEELQMPVGLTARSITAGLPAAALARGAPTLRLRWVDAFRE